MQASLITSHGCIPDFPIGGRVRGCVQTLNIYIRCCVTCYPVMWTTHWFEGGGWWGGHGYQALHNMWLRLIRLICIDLYISYEINSCRQACVSRPLVRTYRYRHTVRCRMFEAVVQSSPNTPQMGACSSGDNHWPVVWQTC